MKDKIMMIIFVLVLGTILTSALVAVNGYTKPIIERHVEIKIKSNILSALQIPFSLDNIDDVFDQSVTEKSAGERTYYEAKGGTLALPYEGSGLWGPIIGVIAMNSDLSKITGITIMQQEETPGLGSRIAEPEYLNTFIGKEFSPELQILPPGKSSKSNQVDAISGATMSCNAFVALLNDAYKAYDSLIGGK